MCIYNTKTTSCFTKMTSVCWRISPCLGGGTRFSCSSGWFESPHGLHHRNWHLDERGTGPARSRAGVLLEWKSAMGWFHLFSPSRPTICSPSWKNTKAQSWSCTCTTRTRTTAERCWSRPTVTGAEMAGTETMTPALNKHRQYWQYQGVFRLRPLRGLPCNISASPV